MNYDDLIRSLVASKNENKINLAEPFYLSADLKTIMGEIEFKELLFLDYRYTEAGSNPREFYGLKDTNVDIFKSLLNQSNNFFRFLHTGVILSLNSDDIITKNQTTINYSDCCLTNGNQTRFLILYITLLKLFFNEIELYELRGKQLKEFKSFLITKFANSDDIREFIDSIELKKCNDIIKYLLRTDKKYGQLFSEISLDRFLTSRIRIQINLLKSITADLDGKVSEASAGTDIAEANNATRIVNRQDLFGNKYQPQLKTYLFDTFISKHKNIQIEYRANEISQDSNKIHVLTLLKPLIPTGLLVKEKDIFNLSNKREAIYKIFTLLMKKIENKKDLAKILSKLINLFYEVRTEYIDPILEHSKDEFLLSYKEKAYGNEIDLGLFKNEWDKSRDDKAKDRVIRNLIKYNSDHIMIVIVYAIKKMITFDKNKNLILSVSKNELKDFFESLINQIYVKYIDQRMKEQYFSSYVRTKEYFEIGIAPYNGLKTALKFTESTLITDNRDILIYDL